MSISPRRVALALSLGLVVTCTSMGYRWAGPDRPAEAPLRVSGMIFPRISDSGQQIAVSYQGAIWRMPRDGGTMTRLTSDDGFDIEPTWSPDGTRLAYTKSRNFFDGTLQLIRADDGAPVKLPRAVAVRDKLYFHPDGRRLLGTFLDANQKPRLAWLDLQTGELGDAVFPTQLRQRYALSHDGRWIVQVTYQDQLDEQMGNFGPQCDLWKIPAAGGQPEKLAHFGARIYDLCFAADDRSLLLVSNLGGAHNDLWQMPLDDPQRGTRKLTFGQADEECPSVSVDGRWLLATDNSEGATRLVLRDLASDTGEWLTVSELDYGQPVGTLNLTLLDDATGQPLTGRCTVQHADGKEHAPPGALYRLGYGHLHSYVEGQAQWSIPAGHYKIRVNHGPEYKAACVECDIVAGQTADQSIRLARWTNQQARGWYSGENHIHANYGYGHWYNSPRTMLAQCAGEDLLVCNFMVANSDGDGVFDREYFRGHPDPLSNGQTLLYWNEEFRSTIWGHMTLVNLKQLVEPIYTGFLQTTYPYDHPTNADIAGTTHDQDGLVNFTHPASNVKDPYLGAYSAKELPIDVALGVIDSIDVMGTGHVATVPLWYRLLNCGFHVPASAGTDVFLNRISSRPPGSDRVYVHVEGEFTYQRWIDGLKAGRTFVTNGPMLELSVEGQEPGATIPFNGPGRVDVVGKVRADYPVNRVELIYNGEVVASAEIKDDGRDVTLEQAVPIAASGWLALRASGPPHPETPQAPYAHTSPVYVAVRTGGIL